MPRPLTNPSAVAAAFTTIAEHRAANGYAPIYARMAAACASDPDTISIAAHAQDGQNPPSLLLGAVHYLLATTDHPLRRFYPALTENPAPAPEHDDPWPDLQTFINEHRDQITHLVATRLVQTHEVGRSTYLHAGLLAAQQLAQTPLAAIEIGPSAGLTLLTDRYAYNYGTGHIHGDPQSPLTLNCELRGPLRPPLEQPLTIAWRSGIDLNPLDLSIDDDRNWLRALVWPDHPQRARRLDTAFAAAQRGPLPTLHQGDVLEHLATLLDQAPKHTTACVYHTAVTAHFTPQARQTYHRALQELSTRRRILWLRAEPGQEPRLRVSDLKDGRALSDTALGHYHPHGAWLQWLHTT